MAGNRNAIGNKSNKSVFQWKNMLLTGDNGPRSPKTKQNIVTNLTGFIISGYNYL